MFNQHLFLAVDSLVFENRIWSCVVREQLFWRCEPDVSNEMDRRRGEEDGRTELEMKWSLQTIQEEDILN